MPAPVYLPHTVGDIARFYFDKVLTGRNWYDLSRNYRNYYWVSLTKNQLKLISRNADTFTFNYLLNGYRNGQYDSYFNPDSLNRQNVGLKGTATWSLYKTHMALDQREPAWQTSGTEQMQVDYLQMQEQNMWNGVYEDREEALWTLPTAPNDGSAGDPVPWGIPYSVVKSSTAAVGLNGGHPSGYSSVYGNSRTTYPQLKNMTGTFATVDHLDFEVKGTDMVDLMHWQPPRNFANEETTDDRYEIVSHRTPWTQWKTLATMSNQNLGPDPAKYRGPLPALGATMFGGVPWNWCDALTQQYLPDGVSANPCYDLQQPVYFLNWNTFQLFAADDTWMKAHEPVNLDDPHNVVKINVDSIYNLANLNPRQNGVLYNSTAA